MQFSSSECSHSLRVECYVCELLLLLPPVLTMLRRLLPLMPVLLPLPHVLSLLLLLLLLPVLLLLLSAAAAAVSLTAECCCLFYQEWFLSSWRTHKTEWTRCVETLWLSVH